jgi:hypothetical protein
MGDSGAIDIGSGSSASGSGGTISISVGSGDGVGGAFSVTVGEYRVCREICPWSWEVRPWVTVAPLTLEAVRLHVRGAFSVMARE